MLFLAYKALTAAILGGILWLDRYQLFQMMFLPSDRKRHRNRIRSW